MWIALAIILAVGWLVLWLVWHVASFAVHLLIAGAVLALVVHFARKYFGARRTPHDTAAPA